VVAAIRTCLGLRRGPAAARRGKGKPRSASTTPACRAASRAASGQGLGAGDPQEGDTEGPTRRRHGMKKAAPRSTSKPSAVAAPRKRILIVDDHPVVRQGLAQILDAEPDLVVCAQAGNVAEGLRCYSLSQPHLLMVDLSLADFDGLELIRQVRARDPEARILVVTMHDEALYAERALRAGALGFVRKHEPAATILEAVRRVLDGKVYLNPRAADQFLGRMVGGRPARAQGGLEQLSDRELEILRLIGQGLKTSEVAQRLVLSVKTVETYRDRIKAKLGLKTASQLMRFAVQWSLGQG
jgi:DNA-binding NarL/FixJ family response regulator